VDAIEEALKEGVQDFRKFAFSLGQIGGFPSTKRARVLWVGVQHGAAELIKLSQAVEEAVTPFGFEVERKPFKPHITIARFKTPKPIEEAISKIPIDSLAGRFVSVDGITIFQSRLKRSGAEYEPLRHIPLHG